MKIYTIGPASLGYRFTLQVAGARCEVRTNSVSLCRSLQDWRITKVEDPEAGSFSMQIFVTAGVEALLRPYHFRGLHHVVVASFGAGNSFVCDLQRRTVFATVSQNVAGDARFWNEVLLPIALGVLGAAVGVVPVHCACLSAADMGVLIAGASGTGKSMLTAALVQSGFEYVSDDWTYLRARSEQLEAYGIRSKVKLLPDAIQFFPELKAQALRTSLNGELAYEVPAQAFGGQSIAFCRPQQCIFLERSDRCESQFIAISTEQALTYIVSSLEPLPSQLGDIAENRAAVTRHIAHLSCWKFCYGGNPYFGAQRLRSFLLRQEAAVPA